VGGLQISKVGDDRTKNEVRTLNLRKGIHPIGWVLTGGDMGTARVRFTPVGAGEAPAPVIVTREMEAAARQPPTRTEFRFGS
jgi:hypothetical protein